MNDLENHLKREDSSKGNGNTGENAIYALGADTIDIVGGLLKLDRVIVVETDTKRPTRRI